MYESQRKYIKDNELVKLSIDIKKSIRDLFSKVCKEKGTTPTEVLKKAINDYLVPASEIVTLKYIGKTNKNYTRDFIYPARIYGNTIREDQIVFEIFIDSVKKIEKYTLEDLKENWTNIGTSNEVFAEKLKEYGILSNWNNTSMNIMRAFHEEEYKDDEKFILIIDVAKQEIINVINVSALALEERKKTQLEYKKMYPASKGYTVNEYIISPRGIIV